MEMERPRPPQGGGGFERPQGGGGGGGNGGGGGGRSSASGDGGGFVFLLVIAVALFATSGKEYVNPMAPSTLLSVAVAILVMIISFGLNRGIGNVTLVLQPGRVFIVSLVFIVINYYSNILPVWISNDSRNVAMFLLLVSLFFRKKLKEASFDMPEIVFGTVGFLAVMIISANVGVVGSVLSWLVNFLGGFAGNVVLQ